MPQLTLKQAASPPTLAPHGSPHGSPRDKPDRERPLLENIGLLGRIGGDLSRVQGGPETDPCVPRGSHTSIKGMAAGLRNTGQPSVFGRG
ncbi:hypothetical protein [Limnohabitans sp. Rim28]|uniref:hypothetical protein n=1 Tax=Limnohabitans sp. Rim28 TaxID=1100720 RepID=UPI00036EA6F4|nr:hypothetical protein [Limnohabitans sp. Rim28]